jgi:hypothetical protein
LGSNLNRGKSVSLSPRKKKAKVIAESQHKNVQ